MAEYRVFQLRLNRESDADRIEWLECQDNVTETIRGLIDGAMELAGTPVSVSASTPVNDDRLDLVAIRRVMECVLDERLQSGMLAGAQPARPGQVDDETNTKLDAMF